jgi:hypothetical protein
VPLLQVEMEVENRPEGIMQRRWSVEEIMASLETEAAKHRERAVFHAGQEELHREKRVHHEAELEAVTRRLDEFRSVSTAALEIMGRLAHQPAAGPEHDFGPASKPRLTRMVDTLLQELKPDQAIGPAWLTQEINRRFGQGLRKPVNPRQISDILRRLARTGRLRQIRQGKGRYEARFVRVG